MLATVVLLALNWCAWIIMLGGLVSECQGEAVQPRRLPRRSRDGPAPMILSLLHHPRVLPRVQAAFTSYCGDSLSFTVSSGGFSRSYSLDLPFTCGYPAPLGKLSAGALLGCTSAACAVPASCRHQ